MSASPLARSARGWRPELHVQQRMRMAQRRNQVAHQRLHERRRDRDAHAALQSPLRARTARRAAAVATSIASAASSRAASGPGELAPAADEQLGAHGVFECGQTPADRGVIHLQLACGAGHRTGAGQGQQDPEVAPFRRQGAFPGWPVLGGRRVPSRSGFLQALVREFASTRGAVATYFPITRFTRRDNTMKLYYHPVSTTSRPIMLLPRTKASRWTTRSSTCSPARTCSRDSAASIRVSRCRCWRTATSGSPRARRSSSTWPRRPAPPRTRRTCASARASTSAWTGSTPASIANWATGRSTRRSSQLQARGCHRAGRPPGLGLREGAPLAHHSRQRHHRVERLRVRQPDDDRRLPRASA